MADLPQSAKPVAAVIGKAPEIVKETVAQAAAPEKKPVAVFVKTQHTLDELKFKDGTTFTFPRVATHSGVLGPSKVAIFDEAVANNLREVAGAHFIVEL